MQQKPWEVEAWTDETRASRISKWIKERIDKNQVDQCLFCILLLDQSYKKQVEELVTRNGWHGYTVDTVGGCWNLNDDWYEFHVKAAVEWGGVYPTEWNLADVVFLEELYYNRKIYIQVYVKDRDGNWMPNR